MKKKLTHCTFEESKVVVCFESYLQRKKCHEHDSAYYEVSYSVCHTLKPFSSLNKKRTRLINAGKSKLVL